MVRLKTAGTLRWNRNRHRAGRGGWLVRGHACTGPPLAVDQAGDDERADHEHDGAPEPAHPVVAGGDEEIVLQHAAQHQPQDERRPGPAEALHEPSEKAEGQQQDQVAEVTLCLERRQEHHHDHQRRQQVDPDVGEPGQVVGEEQAQAGAEDIGDGDTPDHGVGDVQVLGEHVGARADALDQEYPEQDGHGGAAGHAEGQRRDQRAALLGVVGALRRDDAAHVARAEGVPGAALRLHRVPVGEPVHHRAAQARRGAHPTTTALLAGHYGPELPVSYLSFGGFSYPGGVVRPTRLNSSQRLRSIATPAVDSFGRRHFTESDWKALESYAAATAERLSDVPNLLLGDIDRREAYRAAFAAEGLREFADAIPSRGINLNTLRRHAQLAVLAFRTGVAVSADLWIGGFDTHSQHDNFSEPVLSELTGAVDYLWDYAELQGIADRLVVVMGSDFGRTNFYNASDGKDHWPIGSYIVMEKNQTWTDRVVGETDALHFARRINPSTLERDDTRGTIIYPKHVHKALRRYLGIQDTAGAQALSVQQHRRSRALRLRSPPQAHRHASVNRHVLKAIAHPFSAAGDRRHSLGLPV